MRIKSYVCFLSEVVNVANLSRGRVAVEHIHEENKLFYVSSTILLCLHPNTHKKHAPPPKKKECSSVIIGYGKTVHFMERLKHLVFPYI